MMPDPWVVAHCAETHCLAQAPGEVPYLCTEWPNHEGWHRAELDGELLGTWPPELMLSIVVTW